MKPRRFTMLAVLCLAALPAHPLDAQRARISEETRMLLTYPFSEPNPLPVLARDARLYPYHTFEGYAKDPVRRAWKVVRLENELIEVFVLPEVGGKVWGAVVKQTGHEFVYRNEVLKFRNIALRGPWTSGGIEFNFGVIGHTPATATPVDYVLRENADGSVSCVVGAMDLPSRTHWRVEIRVPPDRATFETNVLWYNPTPLTQPYYNWMTAAAFARPDLEMFIPGDAFLEHSGQRHDWPVDSAGRYLPRYAENTFAGHKSYHVVGEVDDFFGGYYHDAGYGFGHWSRYDEMPGQKLWLWALSREGGIWEDLLTDADGQYVEYQAGRLLVQYAPGEDVNPITQVGFEPGATDRWAEVWFPLEGLGGLSDASPFGAVYVRRHEGRVVVRVQAFATATDTLRMRVGNRVAAAFPLRLRPLEPAERSVSLPDGAEFRVELPGLRLDVASDPSARRLRRPFTTDATASAPIPAVTQQAVVAGELAKGRRYHEARVRFDSVVAAHPWHRDARVGLAELEYRRGRYEAGLDHVRRALQLDAYDAHANFVAGALYRAAGATVDAVDAYGWAARSMRYRSAAYVQLAELVLAAGDVTEARHYARLALDYDRYGIPARQILAMIGRRIPDPALADSMRTELLALDPLQHFVRAEQYLAAPDSAPAARLLAGLRSEYPEQTILELAVDYQRRGAASDAVALLALALRARPDPLLRAWHAWLTGDSVALAGGADPTLVFPSRVETLPVLAWAAEHDPHWSWRYLRALNLWALDRAEEAARLFEELGDTPDVAAVYGARAALRQLRGSGNPEPDLRRAVAVDPRSRIMRVQLVRYLQDRGDWRDALDEAQRARLRFAGDFNLDLLAVRSLNELGRWREAVAILDSIQVLPSENARTSHRMYVQAHVLAALDAMDRQAWDRARPHLQAALEWPERLGQGRPYEPEERLIRYLLGIAAAAEGDRAAAQVEFDAVVRATGGSGPPTDRLDLLAIPALAALGRVEDLPAMANGQASGLGRAAARLATMVAHGGDRAAVLLGMTEDDPRSFVDLDGRLILRALEFAP